MACRLAAASHYLNQCWNIVKWTPGNNIQWNFDQNSYIFIQWNAFENVVWKMAAILSRPQCVDEKAFSRKLGCDWLMLKHQPITAKFSAKSFSYPGHARRRQVLFVWEISSMCQCTIYGKQQINTFIYIYIYDLVVNQWYVLYVLLYSNKFVLLIYFALCIKRHSVWYV